jgi:hypothetical protein
VNGSIILCSSAMRRIQRSGLTDIHVSSVCFRMIFQRARPAKEKQV